MALCAFCSILQLCAQRIPTSDNSEFKISESFVTFSHTGGTKNLTVTATNGAPWSIKSQPAAWAKVKKEDKRTLSLTISPNTSVQERTTTSIIESYGREITITVKQSAAPRFEISSQTVNFSSNGGTKELYVTSTNNWEIDRYPNKWCSVRKENNTLILNVNKNTSTTAQSTTFSIKSADKRLQVNVSQAAAELILNVSPTRVSLPPESNTQTFEVSANTSSWTISLPQRKGIRWWHVEQNGNKISLMVTENKSREERSDYFEVRAGNKAKQVTFTQSASRVSSVPESRIMQSEFSVLPTSASFSSSAGGRTFTIESTDEWTISHCPDWCSTKRDGKMLILYVDLNEETSKRSDFLLVKSGTKEIKIPIDQEAAPYSLLVDNSPKDQKSSFSYYGGSEKIYVSSTQGQYKLANIPDWCKIVNRNEGDFTLQCKSNHSRYPRTGTLSISNSRHSVKLCIEQEENYKKWRRIKNGGWVNFAIGFEGGYGPEGGNSWYANGLLGARLGNYRDILQLEVGATPGLISVDEEEPIFHLPLYASLKLSTSNGAYYLKMGGTYNLIRDEWYEGICSLRAGFGSAWKHFEWDWGYVQYNMLDDDYDYDWYNRPKWMVGMRMAWYITW